MLKTGTESTEAGALSSGASPQGIGRGALKPQIGVLSGQTAIAPVKI